MAKAKSNFSFDVVKKNLFWIFVPLAILAMWGLFIVAYSKAQASYKSRMEELENLKKTVGGIKSDSAHPNQGSIDAALEKEKELRQVVYAAWEEMYKAQKNNCTWSTKLHPSFLGIVRDLKWMSPIPGVPVREWYHTFIQNQIPEFLEMAGRRTVEIQEWDPNANDWKRDADGKIQFVSIDPYVADPERMIIQGTKLLTGGAGGMSGGGMMGSGGMSMMDGGGGMGGGFTSFSSGGASGGMGGGVSGGGMSGGMGGDGMGGGMDMGGLNSMAGSANLSLDSIFDSEIQRVSGVVDWPTPEIFSIVTWAGQSPYSGQIWYAQEEVWVYESLIKVVRQINDRVSATGPHNAAVKRIQAMLIGQNAANIVRSPGILQPLGPLTGGGMGMGMGMDDMSMMMDGASSMSDMSMGDGMMMDGMEGGMTARILTESETNALIKKYRYVDLEMKPLSDSDEPPFMEFNMMPVCLELIVDQRRIPEILIECANSTMPIDVKLVRYAPAKAKTGVLGGGMSGGMDGMLGGVSDGSAGMPGRGAGMMSGGGGLDGSSGAMGAASEALSGFEVGGKIGVYGSEAVMIQVIGIIYIYNEPSPEKLATGASAKESGLEGGVDMGEPTQTDDDTETTEPVADEVEPADDEEERIAEEEPEAIEDEPAEETLAESTPDETATEISEAE